MSWRPVGADDVEAVEAFLLAHVETSVFLVANLRRFGPSGGASPRAMHYWCIGDPVSGMPISGVIAQSAGGTVMAQCPACADWRGALAVLPQPVSGMMGEGEQMHAIRSAAGWDAVATSLDADEVLMSLDLAQVRPRPGPGRLMPLEAADRGEMIAWRRDYVINILGADEASATERATRDIEGYIGDDSHRVLMSDAGVALCMTGFNAKVDGLVQVGGVYTPPARRAQGLARRALALHLEEADGQGATRAILFGDNPSALTAYEAVGFEATGRYALIFFREAQAV